MPLYKKVSTALKVYEEGWSEIAINPVSWLQADVRNFFDGGSRTLIQKFITILKFSGLSIITTDECSEEQESF